MKSKNQLVEQMNSCISFMELLSESKGDLESKSTEDLFLIKSTISDMFVQDKQYLEHYFPKMKKEENIERHDKSKEEKESAIIKTTYTLNEILQLFLGTRKQLIDFLEPLHESSLHAFFTINHVQFTMYDHIEHIIFNDSLNMERISEILKKTKDSR